MKQKIPLSIGIPAYNEEANIKYLLSSILAQEMDKFILQEIIIISDGSTDQTVEIIKKIKDQRIKLIAGKTRLGQNKRLNEIVESMSQKSSALLILESDTLPVTNEYIKKLILSIPSDGKYSMIAGNSIPVESSTFFEKIINFGFYLKKDIFENAIYKPNLYLFGGQDGRLFSKTFLKNFRWNVSYHEDSYSFRKAVNSNLPIIRNEKATIYFRSVTNLRDHLLQSGKFLKAKKKEKMNSGLYKLRLNHLKLITITLKHLIKNPVLFILYILVVLYARIYSQFLPQYTEFWDIYISTKKLTSRIK